MYADSTRARLLIRPETAYNETFVIGSTHMQDLRMTGHTLKPAKETVDNEEIRGDGSMSRQDQVGTSVAGDINANLSYGTYDPYIAAALRNAPTGWSSNALGVGIAPPTFAIEPGNLDISRFWLLTGCYIGAMTLDIASKKAIGLTFAVMGAQGLPSTTASVDAAPVAKTTTEHMRSGAGIPSLSLAINGGSAAPHPGKVTSLRVQTDPGLRARPNVQSLASDIMGIGEFKVTATISGYLADASLYDACLAHQDVALDFVTADSLGNQYHWYIDRATITDHTATPGSKNQDVLNSYTIQGYGVNALRVARTPAA